MEKFEIQNKIDNSSRFENPEEEMLDYENKEEIMNKFKKFIEENKNKYTEKEVSII